MLRTVEMPLWALVLILAFAAVTFASHFLFPSVRWFFRRRMERAVARINTRLQRPIQPFKLARRYDKVLRLSYDPEVARTVSEVAEATGTRPDVLFQRARKYAREIVPRFSAFAYFGFATRAARWLARGLYAVRVGEFDEAAAAAVDSEATVVFVINHRSNMDYVLVTYLAANRTTLSYAVGEWARIWPLSALIRAMGAYFIRRTSRGPLYRKVLQRYVKMATEGGETQAVFPEGGLSLDGAMGPPKLGILSYICEDYVPTESRKVVFVPVGINYDWVLEDRVLISAGAAGDRRFHVSIRKALARGAGAGLRMLFGRFKRFGVAGVRFGAPIPLDGLEGDVEALGAALMGKVAELVPITPVPLVAYALGEGAGREELGVRAEALVGQAEAAGVFVHLPAASLPKAIDAGLATLRARGIITGQEHLAPAPGQEALVAFYARSIAHHF